MLAFLRMSVVAPSVTKRLLDRFASRSRICSTTSAGTVEQLAQSLLYTTEDKREGAEAFLAKRAPEWSGR